MRAKQRYNNSKKQKEEGKFCRKEQLEDIVDKEKRIS